ncbi:MAG: outer membrane protein assembly factor BamB [Gammaproteobacteria bacterium RIFCSPHIGHO2_02_FULL_42_13]|nr:MAG: outer membrane protein assembly factor BamB [Gammaproteobacteria bacterium RIFCSPHIGHO2_02_FULL_42_13]OGT70206.1 MAG: outer membrane protein assembly factor BamB [Gammaproteobacteria bacterium RIFCSPLOWO2_02_FULL_42_9]
MKKVLYRMSVIFFIIFLAACASKDNTLPPSPLVNFTPTLDVQQLWLVSAGNGSSKDYLRLTPVVSGQSVFVASSDGDLYSMDTQTGKTLWKTNVANSLTSGPSVDDGKVFVATGEGGVAALNQSTGEILWQTPVASEILSKPTSFKGTVLVKSIDGSLTALSASDGRQLWRFQQTVPSLILHASGQPEVAGSTVIAGFANGKLGAFNFKSGKLLWLQSIADPQGSTDVERMVDIDVNPVVINGIVYVATYQGYIAALDLKTGRLIWRHTISSYAGIAADYSRLYLSDAKSYVWGFNNDDGVVAWRQKSLLGRKITEPAILGDYVVVGDSEGYLHWMSKSTGKFVARSLVDESGLIAPPVAAGNTLYAYTTGGNLYAFRVVQK